MYCRPPTLIFEGHAACSVAMLQHTVLSRVGPEGPCTEAVADNDDCPVSALSGLLGLEVDYFRFILIFPAPPHAYLPAGVHSITEVTDYISWSGTSTKRASSSKPTR